MKHILSILLLICCFAVYSKNLPRPFEGDKRPARQIKIDSAAVLKLSKGETIEIILPEKASRSLRFAAEELQLYLKKTLNANTILTKVPSGKSTAFYLGISEWSKKAGIQDSTLCRDAFIMKRNGKNIYIVGRDGNTDATKNVDGERGTLFGVYDFLERFCGVRFYFYDERFIIAPSVETLSIPGIDIYDRPDFEYRRLQIFEGIHGEEKTFADKIPNRHRWNNMLRLQTKDVPNCHGLAVQNFIERFGKDHPEYFARLSNGKRHNDPTMRHPGQICFSSGIREEIYQDAKACLLGQPASSRGIVYKYKGMDWHPRHQKGYLFNIMPQDGMIACTCESCAPIFQQKTEQAASDFIWQFVADTANRLKKENVPGYLSMMTYHYYRHVPKVDIPDNVVVMFACLGPWSMHTPLNEQNNKRMRAWNTKLKDKVYLWNYANKFASLRMPGVPHSTPECIGKYYKSVSGDIYGAFMESETDYTVFNMLNYYVFSKVAWNKDTDVNAILEDFYNNMFGKAAPHMKKFFKKLESNWVNKIAGRSVETAEGPVNAPPSDFELWNNIYSPSVLMGLRIDLTNAKRLVSKGSAEAANIEMIWKLFYAPIEEAANKYNARISAVQGLKFYIQDKPGNKISLLPFLRLQNTPAAKETVKTEVQAWRTSEELCIRFLCEEPEMTNLVAHKRKFDDREIWMDNTVEVFLNPTGDRKTYYQILVNSEGASADQKTVKLGSDGSNDFSWNSGAKISVEKQASSWSVEIRIPLKNLPGIKNEFPINFARSRILKSGTKHQIHYQWSPFARGYHDLENYGTILTGEPPKNILINSDFSMWSKYYPRYFGIFEKGKWQGGWIGENNKNQIKIGIDTTQFITPPSAIKLEGKNVTLVQYLPKLKPNTKYRLSYYVKVENIKPFKNPGGVCVNLWDDKNNWFPRYNYLTGTTGWIFQSHVFTTGKNTNVNTKSYIRLRIMFAEGTVWFDEVKLEEL